LLSTNRTRPRTDPEYELIDTGVFDEDRYFDVFVEYAANRFANARGTGRVCNGAGVDRQRETEPAAPAA